MNINKQEIEGRIRSLCNKYFDDFVAYRQHIHQNPELSTMEKQTQDYICSLLDSWQIEYKKGVGGYGVVGFLEGKTKEGKTIAMRADMDALPMQEETGLSFSSKNNGVMHACGHDLHMTALLGTIKLLKELKDSFSGRFMFIFQPSEETYPGGAIKMINEGVFDGVKIDHILSFHATPELDCGTVGMKEGKFMASTDEIYIDVIGRGGHGAMPQFCIDPILVASHIVIALQSIVSRNAEPTLPTTFSVGKMIANGRTNIIPSEVKMECIIRTFDEDWRKECHRLITQIAEQTAKAFGAEAKVFVDSGYPYLINDTATTQRAIDFAKEYIGEENVLDCEPRMTAEDFAYFSHKMPACYYRIGTRKKGEPITNLHSPIFDIDQESIRHSIGLGAYLAVSFLNE